MPYDGDDPARVLRFPRRGPEVELTESERSANAKALASAPDPFGAPGEDGMVPVNLAALVEGFKRMHAIRDPWDRIFDRLERMQKEMEPG